MSAHLCARCISKPYCSWKIYVFLKSQYNKILGREKVESLGCLSEEALLPTCLPAVHVSSVTGFGQTCSLTGCSSTVGTERHSCFRDCAACEARNVYSLGLCTKVFWSSIYSLPYFTSKLKDLALPVTAQKKREDILLQKDHSGCKEIKGKQAVHAPEECRAWGN